MLRIGVEDCTDTVYISMERMGIMDIIVHWNMDIMGITAMDTICIMGLDIVGIMDMDITDLDITALCINNINILVMDHTDISHIANPWWI